jgi:hypothetical protein
LGLLLGLDEGFQVGPFLFFYAVGLLVAMSLGFCQLSPRPKHAALLLLGEDRKLTVLEIGSDGGVFLDRKKGELAWT